MSAKYTLGAYLRRGRERSGLSVEAVSAGSRIVPRLVDALEAGRQDLLPAPVYVRGFIRAYCEEIGADADEALRLYDEQAVPPPPLTVHAPPLPARPLPAARRWRRVAVVSVPALVLGVAGIFMLGRRQPDAVASRGAGATMTASRSSAAPPPVERTTTAAPPPSAAATAPAVPSPPAAAKAPVAPVSSAPASAERVLLMRAIDTTWVRVRPDGAGPTEETLSPGSVREWRSPGRFHVTLGNAGGVELELDGRALPALGARGQVVRDATVPGETQP
jgi:cytoskeleton protein RodZ